MVLEACTGAGSQRWKPGPYGFLVNTRSGLCLQSVSEGGVGGELRVKTCSSDVARQKWSRPSGSWPTPNARPIYGLDFKCLDAGGRLPASEDQVTLYICDESDGQQWVPDANTGELKVSKEVYDPLTKKIETRFMCLNTEGQRTESLTNVVVSGCVSGSQSQKWVWAPQSGAIRHKDSGLCLGVKGSDPANGTPLVISPCAETANQAWDVATNRSGS